VVYLTRLLLPFLLGISMAALFSALLQAEERFLPYALGPIAFNLAAIGLMALFPGDPTFLGLSVGLGGLLQAAVQLPFLKGLRLEWRWHPAFATALLRMGPFAFTTSLRQFLNLVLTNILTRYPPAAVTGFYNAEVVFQMALGLLATSPAIAYFPRMSALKGEELARFLESPLRASPSSSPWRGASSWAWPPSWWSSSSASSGPLPRKTGPTAPRSSPPWAWRSSPGG
jgi:putative peptidoglycan lipid II flippase